MNDQTITSWAGAVLQSQLPAAVKHVLLTLGCHTTDDGQIHLRSLAELAHETSRPEGAVLGAIKFAQAAGWIETNGINESESMQVRCPCIETSQT